MKIKYLKLRNFRCFGCNEKIIDFDNLTTLIGINSCGKTAILYALMKLFGRSVSIRALERADFHVPKDKQPEDMVTQDLHVEAVISFPELDDDDENAKSTVPIAFEHMYVTEPGGDPFVRIRLEGKWNSGNTPEGDIDQNYYFITCPESPEEISADHKKPATSSDLAKIEFVYVPAIRNPSVQLRNASGTILWRILNGINWPGEINQQIKTLGKDIDNQFCTVAGFNKLQEVLLEEWKKLHSDARYTNVRVGFNAGDFTDILNKLDVRFFPTETPGSYNVDSLGEGLRSLFYLSLASSLLQLENEAIKDDHNHNAEDGTCTTPKLFSNKFTPSLLTILAVEEPENHIAPHLVGRIMKTLTDISIQPNVQVVVTSHSPAIVKRVNPESIRYLRMCPHSQHTLVNTINLPAKEDEKYQFVKESVLAYPEIFFARLVVLGEGDTEEIVIPKALRISGRTLDESAVCVVPLGGRMVNHFWRLLKGIDIPFVTLLDLDLERETGGWARIKYVIDKLLENSTAPDTLVNKLIASQLISKREDISNLHQRLLDRAEIQKYIPLLEEQGVFFAFPLDMDFMMLCAFTDAYRSTKDDRGGLGPRIPDPVKKPDEYQAKIADAVKVVLKSDDAIGKQYSEDEKTQMIWYKYLFLERGKPTTHLLALSKLENNKFKNDLPAPIDRLLDHVSKILSNDPQSKLFKNA